MNRETLEREIAGTLPKPIKHEENLDGESVWIGGDPGEVVVRVNETQVVVSLYTIQWNTPHTPTVRPIRLGMLEFDKLPAARMSMLLHFLVDSASDLRRSSYGKCQTCGQTNPPEWMHDENTCQSCAEKHLGIVY